MYSLLFIYAHIHKYACVGKLRSDTNVAFFKQNGNCDLQHVFHA